MSSRSAAARSDARNLTQADCLRTHSARVAASQKSKARCWSSRPYTLEAHVCMYRVSSRRRSGADSVRVLPARSSSSVSEAVEDATLFMVHYLQEVQGPKYVVGRAFTYIAASPDARRMFLSTAKHLLLQARPVPMDLLTLYILI